MFIENINALPWLLDSNQVEERGTLYNGGKL